MSVPVLPSCCIYNTKTNLLGLLLAGFVSWGCFHGYVGRFWIISSRKLFSFLAKCILCNLNCLICSDVPEKAAQPGSLLFLNTFPRHIFHIKHRQRGLLYTLICYAVSMLSSCSIKPTKHNSIRSENTICCFSAPLTFLIVHLSPVIFSHMSFCVFSLWSHSSK